MTVARADQSAKRLTLIRASTLEGHHPPDRQWLVEQMIPAGNVVLLAGDGGAGKSTIAIQLGVAAATGTPWLGREVERGPVILVSAEDDQDEVHRRLVAITVAQGLALSDLTDLHFTSLAGEEALLAVPATDRNAVKVTNLFEALRDQIRTLTPRLIVIDTAADTFGGDENNRGQVRSFITMLRSICRDTGATVLLLSHPSVAGMATFGSQRARGVSGSTAWSNSVRARLYLTDTGDYRQLEVAKNNYGAIGQKLNLCWQSGIFVPISSSIVAALNARAESVFLELLRDANNRGDRLSARAGRNYAPTVFAKLPAAKGIKKGAFRAAMNALFEQRRIVEIETGPQSKRRKHIEVA